VNKNLNGLPGGSRDFPRKLPPLRKAWTIDRVQQEMDAGTWPPEDWQSSETFPEQSPQQSPPEPEESLSDRMTKYNNSLKEIGPLEIEDYPSLEELTAEVYAHLAQTSSSPESNSPTPSIPASLLRAMLDL